MITVHHLNFSRSTRILWLCEELGLSYEMVRHERNEKFKAPEALGQVHPLGKAPVIQDGDLVLAESAVILSYVNETYGEGRLAPKKGTPAYWQHEEWLQYVESTAALPVMILRLGALTGGVSPGLQTFITPVLEKTLNHIAHAVRTGPYLMGEAFTLADIQMSYLLEVAGRAGMLATYPEIGAYMERLHARPAFGRALAVGGPMMPAAA